MDQLGTQVPRRLRRLPSWQLNRAALRANRLTGEVLAAADMRKHHYAVLVSLEEQGPAGQAALGERLSIDPSDMVATLGHLEKAGCVERARDEHDRRRNGVRLTPAGAEALARLSAQVDAAQEELLAPLTDKERRKLRKLLARVIEPGAPDA